MRLRYLLLSLTPILALSAYAVAPVLIAPQEEEKSVYEIVPPDPAMARATIEELKISMVEAIAIAEERGKSKAYSVSFESEGRPVYRVKLYGSMMIQTIKIDANTGTAISTTRSARFPGQRVDGEPQTTESGLMFYDMVEGSGETPAGKSSKVTVHYTGWLNDGTKFDSSLDSGQPITFPLDRVIAGWTEGVASMKAGGKRKLVIPYDLGYGERGQGATIPPKALLIFDIELISFED
ncbi:MAG: hypothetical protein ACI8QS_001461 [Planctomycetota bacterium]|jgi:hypothetical protein